LTEVDGTAIAGLGSIGFTIYLLISPGEPLFKLNRTLLSSLLLTGLSVATPAFASTIDTFTITDNFGTPNNPVYTFSLASSPTGISSNSNSFTITGVTVLTNGGNSMVDNIAFLTQATGGVLIEFATPQGAELFVEDPGTAFFTGSTSAPTFTPGVYLGENVTNPSDKIQVVISSSAVPEPGSLALLGTGALGLVGMVRRKLAV
jgi:PEP-CTERM motif